MSSTKRANGKIYHIFKANHFRDVQNLYQDEESFDITLHEFKILTCTCCNEKYPFLTFDMMKDKYNGRHRLGLKSLFVPHSSSFQIN